MLGYLQSNLPWSTYLNTLSPIARRHYLNSDVHIEITQSLDQPSNATRSSLTSPGGYPSATAPTVKAAPTTRDPIMTSHSLSRPGGYNSAPIAAKRRHTDPRDNGKTPAQHHQPSSHQQPRHAVSERQRTRSHTKTEQTQGKLDDAASSSTQNQSHTRPRYPDASLLPQHLMPQERELTRIQLHNRILIWHRKNGHQDTLTQDQTSQPNSGSTASRRRPRQLR